MNKLLNQKLLFLISLLCVVTVTVGAVFLPRYLSRGLDKSRLNKVTVSDRSHFSYLEQSSGGIIENIQALSFMKSEANLMLLSDMKADTARLNTDLLENVYNQAMIASEYGMLPWLGVGDYKTLRKSSYDVVTDWEDDIRFARYYSLTYDSDNDENTKELLNLWFLRFSDNNTFDYYFLVDASDYTIYYAEIHNDWTAAEAEAMEIIKAESSGNEINITISEGIDQSATLDVSDSSLETGVLWYYNAESCRYVVGDYTNSYHALLVLHFEDGTVYMEETPVDSNATVSKKGIAVGVRGVQSNLNQLNNKQEKKDPGIDVRSHYGLVIPGSYYQILCVLQENTEDATYFSKNLYIIHNDRIHGIVLRLETIVSVFFIKSLNRSRIIHKCNDHFTVRCQILLTNHDIIAVKDTCIYHTFTFDFQHEAISVWHIFCRDREISFNMLLRQNRLTGCNSTYHRNINDLTAGQIKTVIHDLDSSWFRRVSADISVLLQCLQMRMDRRCGLQVNRFTDIPHCRRISFAQYFRFNKIKYLLLLGSDLSICHKAYLLVDRTLVLFIIA